MGPISDPWGTPEVMASAEKWFYFTRWNQFFDRNFILWVGWWNFWTFVSTFLLFVKVAELLSSLWFCRNLTSVCRFSAWIGSPSGSVHVFTAQDRNLVSELSLSSAFVCYLPSGLAASPPSSPPGVLLPLLRLLWQIVYLQDLGGGCSVVSEQRRTLSAAQDSSNIFPAARLSLPEGGCGRKNE